MIAHIASLKETRLSLFSKNINLKYWRRLKSKKKSPWQQNNKRFLGFSFATWVRSVWNLHQCRTQQANAIVVWWKFCFVKSGCGRGVYFSTVRFDCHNKIISSAHNTFYAITKRPWASKTQQPCIAEAVGIESLFISQRVIFFSVWGSFPCCLLHFGAKISDLQAICCILKLK